MKSIKKHMPIIFAAVCILLNLAVWTFLLTAQAETKFDLSDSAKQQLKGFCFSGILQDAGYLQYITFDDGKITNKFSLERTYISRTDFNAAENIFIPFKDNSSREKAVQSLIEGENDILVAHDAKQGDVFFHIGDENQKMQINTGLKYNLSGTDRFITFESVYGDGTKFYPDFHLSTETELRGLKAEIDGKAYFTPFTNSCMTGDSGIWRVDSYVPQKYVSSHKAVINGREQTLNAAEFGSAVKITSISRRDNFDTLFVDSFNDKLLLFAKNTNDLMLFTYNVDGELLDKTILTRNITTHPKSDNVFIQINKNEQKQELAVSIKLTTPEGSVYNELSVLKLDADGKILKQVNVNLEGRLQKIDGVSFSKDMSKIAVFAAKYIELNESEFSKYYSFYNEFEIFSDKGEKIFGENYDCGLTKDANNTNNLSRRRLIFDLERQGNAFIPNLTAAYKFDAKE